MFLKTNRNKAILFFNFKEIASINLKRQPHQPQPQKPLAKFIRRRKGTQRADRAANICLFTESHPPRRVQNE